MTTMLGSAISAGMEECCLQRGVQKGGAVVLGVGNIVHRDDGAGIHALRRLARDPRVPGGVGFIDGGTFGIELLAYLHDAARLLLLDAVDIGEQTGTVVHIGGRDLAGLKGGASVHQIGVADLLAALQLASSGPTETVLLGVQVGSTDWGTELSPPVEAALDQVVEAALNQLARWKDVASFHHERILDACTL